jgi:sec-independent protein translocase protein TatC
VSAKLTPPELGGGGGKEPLDEVEASRAPLMDHLTELRQRLVRVLICLVVLFIAAWFITEPGMEFLLQPMKDAFVRRGHDIAEFKAWTTAPLEMLMVKLKLAFLIGIAVGFPYIAYQVYAFVAPGLYKKERSAILPFLFVMPVLFFIGAALVYYYVLPSFMDLTYSQETDDVSYLGQVKSYYDLSISLLTCFGFAFQLPVVIALLSKAGVVESSTLRKGRKYAILIIFVVAAVMTPPDPFSQFLLAMPLIGLYESGIACAWLIERGRKRREAAEAKREEEEAKREAEEKRKRDAAAAQAPTISKQPGE